MLLKTGATFRYGISKERNVIRWSGSSNTTRTNTYDVSMERRTEFEELLTIVGRTNRNDKLAYTDKQCLLTKCRKQLLEISNEPA